MGTDALTLGRDAFDGRRWTETFTHLAANDKIEPLEPEDLERLATATFLLGMNDESAEAWTRAHPVLLERADPVRAARCIFLSGPRAPRFSSC